MILVGCPCQDVGDCTGKETSLNKGILDQLLEWSMNTYLRWKGVLRVTPPPPPVARATLKAQNLMYTTPTVALTGYL